MYYLFIDIGLVVDIVEYLIYVIMKLYMLVLKKVNGYVISFVIFYILGWNYLIRELFKFIDYKIYYCLMLKLVK